MDESVSEVDTVRYGQRTATHARQWDDWLEEEEGSEYWDDGLHEVDVSQLAAEDDESYYGGVDWYTNELMRGVFYGNAPAPPEDDDDDGW